jgi:hypothetical protein
VSVTCDRSGFSPSTPVSSTNKTCARCNPVVTDPYDSLETAAIGMCVDG